MYTSEDKDFNNDAEDTIDVETNEFKYIHDVYLCVKDRSIELKNVYNTTPINHKKNIDLASRLYKALSTILYASIATQQRDGLERFIVNASNRIPTNLFDIKEWRLAIDMSKKLLLDSSKVYFHDIFESDISIIRKKMKYMKQQVRTDIDVMRTDVDKFVSNLVPLLQIDVNKRKLLEEDNKRLQQRCIDIEIASKISMKEAIALTEKTLYTQFEVQSQEMLRHIEQRCQEKMQRVELQYKTEMQQLEEQCLEKMQRSKDQYQEEMQRLEIQCEDKMQRSVIEHEDKMQRSELYYQTEIQRLEVRHEEKLQQLVIQYEGKMQHSKGHHQTEIQQLEIKFEDKLQRSVILYEDKIQRSEEEHQDKVKQLEELYQDKMQRLEEQCQDKVQQLEELYKDKMQLSEEKYQDKVQQLEELYKDKMQLLEEQCHDQMQISEEKHHQDKVQQVEESYKDSMPVSINDSSDV